VSPIASSRSAPSSIFIRPRRDVALDAEHAQRRAALAGAVERRADDVADHLLGERRRVDDHRVLAAGLGDERHRLPVRAEAAGEALLQQPRDLGRAGEEHALDARVADERGAHGLAAARQELQHRARHARRMQRAHRLGGDQRRLLGGLGEHRIAAASAAATWPVKIASGKFHGLMQTTGPSGLCVALSKSRCTCLA
jgi:hypothetical protein